jgi:alkaline phosphatase
MQTLKSIFIILAVLVLVGTSSFNSALAGKYGKKIKKVKKAKNVIVMISDGAGYNTHLSTEYWHGMKQPYDNQKFKKYAVATYNLRYGGPDGTAPYNDTQDPELVYDPTKAWDDDPVSGDADGDGYPDYFEGYQWLQSTDPDSAGTMSAIVTGRKVYRGGINIDGFGNPLLTAPEIAKKYGKSTGSISTVRYNHATPAAGGGAHNISRNNYLDISYEMFGSGILDVMGGPGHPCYNSNGTLRDDDGDGRCDPNLGSSRFDEYLWDVISNGSGTASRTTVDDREFTVEGSDWLMLDSRRAIEALASGELTVKGKKLMMLPKVWGTLQYERDITQDWDGDGNLGNVISNIGSYGQNQDLLKAPVNPGDYFEGDATDIDKGDPMIPTVPTLVDMTMAAINHLDDNPKGFYLSIEGGACDWAMHGNSIARMIEEHTDFNNAVQAVIDYLDENTNGNNWRNTLLIVTSDHDHNLYGPDSDITAFQDVSDEGVGENPGHIWHDDNHGNQLVPAWVRGPNAGLFRKLVDGKDPVHGNYIDQVDLGYVMKMSIMKGKHDDGDDD